jgi:CHAT domain-containing protein/tetratricopeptide (TPR) repeat protein
MRPLFREGSAVVPPKTHVGRITRIVVLAGVLALCQIEAAKEQFTQQDSKDDKRANELFKAKRFQEAAAIDERLLAKYERVLGPNHKETLTMVAVLATIYQQMGNKAKALELFERALRGFDRVDPGSARRVSISENLALLYFEQGSNAKAAALWRGLLKLEEKKNGAPNELSMRLANNLALALRKLGQYQEAAELYERVLRFDQQRSGESADTATSALQLGLCYGELGQVEKAESLFKYAIKIRENLFGKGSTEVKDAIGNLASLYSQQGDTKRALELVEGVLADGKENPTETLETAKTLNNLAVMHQRAGDNAKAEPLLQRALAIVERIQGKEHPDTASALNNVATLKAALGHRQEAALLFERALAIREKALGPQHPDVALSLKALGGFYVESGDAKKGAQFLDRALVIFEKTYGNQHDLVISCLSDLGVASERSGEPGKARMFFQRALTACEAAHGPGHFSSAAILNNLATLVFTQGDAQSALPLLRRALEMFNSKLGPEHPTTVGIVQNVALAEFQLGHFVAFNALALRADQGFRAAFANILSFASEEERLSWQHQQSPLTLYALAPNPTEFARCLLRYKGIVLDSIIEDRAVARAASDSGAASSLEVLQKAKQAFWQATLAAANNASEQTRKELDASKAALNDAEKKLARGFTASGRTRHALDVDLAQVRASLPTGVVLIEIARYLHFLGKDNGALRYAAVIIAAQGDTHFIPLGPSESLDKLVELFAKSIRGAADDETLRVSLQKLSEQIWLPIERKLPAGTTRVILSPDGDLSFLPFAALTGGDGRFVCERYRIDYMSSGRDILTKTKQEDGHSSAIFTNPAFAHTTAKANTSERSVTTAPDLRHIRFLPLPGAEREGRLLAARFKADGLVLQLFNGMEATETQLRALNSPRILHLATHGFFLAEHTPTIAKSGGEINPMQRSGLALEGAEITLDAWRKGQTPATGNDGILTSEEISTLKLDGTWLVTLSACDTGSGEARFGEGVMGMRRGFIQAGTQNLLMTLWPISDESTVQIMLDFYDAAFKTGDAPQALADTQRDWLVKLRKEKGLLAAVRLAGPFIMSSQGKP